MTDKQIAVKVDHVSKYFKLPTEATNSLRTALVNRFKGIKGYKEQHVLKDISFEVEKGDFFGILGRNGSGKSTLLKIISEIYVPEKGTVTIDGKLVSFIELGVGFNPELTGRENVYMNGAMLGFSTAEIDAMYDDIVDFAELHEFMNQKLKNYSSGMQVRLAFSVAIKAQGDILILDEVLAVGDEAFQRKCNDYFQERKKSGKTTILVTHDMGAVKKYCNKAVLIENGLVKAIGDPFDVSDQYSFDNLESNSHYHGDEDEGLVTTEVEDFTARLLSPKKVTPDDEVVIEFSFNLLDESVNPHIAFSFVDISTGNGLYNDNSMDIPLSGIGAKKITYKCKLPYFNHVKLRLVAFLRDENQENLAILSTTNPPVFSIDRVVDRTNRSELDSSTGLLIRQGKWE
ncbi:MULTISPECIES: ABC transporter ATP-binding protein [Streptococcus]|mgnify:FL=1|uniref:ATP-binding cassette domain-containing protein n=1 Tax=Streptococcus parasanguinis TaxID=1318 RepID=A0A6L6LG78_STRPA|nr:MULTISPECIES: ABC transporter ATP-binding protein [Streptococcus]MTR63139.1 ATP-binding cassette domain-containing protein [Streptococcus parasanguinis]MTR63960.1 ATP-binding cassette domain-containing protein [Streptococcus parasanguinis]MTR68584.1 ATP-binding cassette domain-containing protein [Streptococcus parasanguinis]MTS05008.1 ATP-binding cassette domain-containing protein [Streptococcus parasanguinis]OFQ78975.1 ABC transporter ATP-binding protein [Streptococcus sp. HMSC065C01]